MFARLKVIPIEYRIAGVIAVASCFLILELVVGFITRSLALVADAFHILSDIIGYAVALLAAKYANRPKKAHERYTYGLRRAETQGGFFNGAFLMALGVSVLLQSIERFAEPSEITDPALVMAVGAAGVGSNVIMLLILGGHAHGGHSHGGHDHGHGGDQDHSHDPHAEGTVDGTGHNHHGHAHVRASETKKPSRFQNVNILGVLIHILGDALNSVAVIISAGIYMATGFVYADPIASFFVGCMIIGTAWPLTVRAGRSLLVAAPETIDVKGVLEDIQRITGQDTVHDLHVWGIDSKTSIASLHLRHNNDSLASFDGVSEEIRKASPLVRLHHHTPIQQLMSKCLHLWGIHSVTIQPEPEDTGVTVQPVPVDEPPYPPAAPDTRVQAMAAVASTASTPRIRFAGRCERQCAGAWPDRMML